jgi:predicted nucleic acid-binding protein
VIDASALAAVLFGEPDAEAVAEELASHRLIAPTLIRYEIASVCLTKSRRYPDRAGALAHMLRLVPEMGIDEVQIDASETVHLAKQTGLTAYDAAYLWVARRIAAPLKTLDAKLAAAAGELGLRR